MVPTASAAGPLTGITRDGSPVAFTTETIKGVEYAVFDGDRRALPATYAVDDDAAGDLDVAARRGDDGTATITWTTNEPSDSRVDYGTAPGSLDARRATDAGLATAHSVALTGLAPGDDLPLPRRSADAAGNDAGLDRPPATLRDAAR